MSNPLVSIIIPAYNRANLIGETLQSIAAQSYTNWECIVVDDHSDDETEAVVKRFAESDKRFQLLRRPNDRLKGANACRNFGFENSKGSLINWFDSDDIMRPNKLELQVDVFKNKDLAFTVCQTEVFEGATTNVLGLRKKHIYSENFFNDFVTNKIKWLTQAPMFRLSFIVENELCFDETLQKAQERDFFVKVLAKVDHYHHMNVPLVLFRKHEDSISFGQNSKEKIASTFRANHRIIEDHRDRLQPDTIAYLKQILKSEIKKSILLKEFDLLKKFVSELDGLKVLDPIEKLKLKLGIFTLKTFNKGDILIK